MQFRTYIIYINIGCRETQNTLPLYVYVFELDMWIIDILA